MRLEQFTKQVIHEKFQIDSNEIDSENSMTLLGITIDNRLSFDDHISKLRNKGSMQLNAIFKLKKYMGQKELDGFYLFQFHLLLLCGTLALINILKKLKIYKSVVLD